MKRKLKKQVHKALSLFGLELHQDPLSRRYSLRKKKCLGANHLADIGEILRGPPTTIFDVGAHIGETAMDFLDSFPKARIYCFEPDTDSYRQLSRAVGGYPRVHCLNCALGENSGVASFYRNAFDQTNSLLKTDEQSSRYIAPDLLETRSVISVDVRAVDGFRREHQIDTIDLLKIDSQGYEMKILRGAEQSLGAGAIPLIYLEVNFVPVYECQPSFHEIIEYLVGFGYRLVGLYECGFGNSSFLVGGNALFVNEPVIRERRVPSALSAA